MPMSDIFFEMCGDLLKQKGHHVFDFPSEFVVLDLETTGLSWKSNEIIEMAAIKVKDGQVVAEFQEYVKPYGNIPEFITVMTGISDETVKDARKVTDVLPDLLNFIGEDIIVGHNIAFDIGFIRWAHILAFDAPFARNYIDTIKLAKAVCPDQECYKLGYLYETIVQKPITDAHRALGDCKMTLDLFNAIKQTWDGLDQFNKDIVVQAQKEREERRKYGHVQLNIKDIQMTVDPDQIDKDNPLYGKSVCITGAMNIPRVTALQVVKNLGGDPKDNVTKKLDYLVIGDKEYISKDGSRSGKVIKAEKYILEGADIKILDEHTFFQMIFE